MVQHAIKKIETLPLTSTYYTIPSSPVGPLTLVASEQGLHAVLWAFECLHPYYKKTIEKLKLNNHEPISCEAENQLKAYFQGKRQYFNLPLMVLGTDFQIQVWNILLQIPYGETLSYGAQASKIGNKNKARAAGKANGLNPIAIIVPCHRVIGSSGHLVGFGGGVEKKSYLLQLEHNTLHQTDLQ